MRARLASVLFVATALPLNAQPTRPFGTLKDQADRQQQWLQQRLTTILPALMKQHGVDLWVVPMREYNEDPVFTSLVSPTTFAARRRTIYVFFDRCAHGATPNATTGCVERIALGGTSQGGLYEAVRSTKAIDAAVGGRQAELWGDQQWTVLKDVIEQRNPNVIGIDVSRTFAFSDGLSAGELDGMSAALGAKWTARFKHAEALPLELIATRVPDEEVFFTELTKLVHQLIGRMFSNEVIRPGVTRTSDLVWWWRQQVNDLGLGTWFQPSVDVQRRGATAEQIGDDPVIQRGDVLHCDVGITAMRLNTDTQHDAYVLLEGETDAPAGLRKALANSNRFQDILMEEVRPGRTGNDVLKSSLARLTAERISGTMYSHPIGMHGHGAGPLIGLWDYQEGVPGRGDAKIIPSMWFSSELQTTTPVPEWGGQPVRMAQEEDFFVGADGKNRWAYQRQSQLHLVR
jgi:Xaa-Pro aminopeptidase